MTFEAIVDGILDEGIVKLDKLGRDTRILIYRVFIDDREKALQRR